MEVVFLGAGAQGIREPTNILFKLAKGEKASSTEKAYLKVGVDTLPDLPKDNTDRNRTSPFAFTGNKFEFRMVGSSQSIPGQNVALNTTVAEALDIIATRLEKAKDKNAEISAIIKDAVKKHGRIIFNGNNYAEEWVAEAAKRGLPNVRNTVDALKAFTTPKALALFAKYKVLSHEELHSRYEIYLEQYAKHINIEARTASQMVRRQFLPAAMLFMTELGNSVKAAGAAAKVQKALLAEVGALVAAADKTVKLVGPTSGGPSTSGSKPSSRCAMASPHTIPSIGCSRL